MAFVADNGCFVCGPANAGGLQLTFAHDGEMYVTTCIVPATYQGYQGIVHGGILSTLLDEVMARLVWERYGPAATARLAVRFHRPAPIGVPLEFRGWITAARRGGQLCDTAAQALLVDGTLLAEATALVVRVTPGEGDTAWPQ
jgi:acyl-coenzyme A thioesterase PaaI-like protein